MSLKSFIHSKLHTYSDQSRYLEYLFKKALERRSKSRKRHEDKLDKIDTPDTVSYIETDNRSHVIREWTANKVTGKITYRITFDDGKSFDEYELVDESKWKEYLNSDLDPESKEFKDQINASFNGGFIDYLKRVN